MGIRRVKKIIVIRVLQTEIISINHLKVYVLCVLFVNSFMESFIVDLSHFFRGCECFIILYNLFILIVDFLVISF